MKYIQTSSIPEIRINSSEIINPNFEELVIEAIDQALLKLGEETKQSVYSLLEVDYKLARKDIPNRLGDFVNALEQIFGISALLIEIDVLKKIRQKVPSFTFIIENADLNFKDYLKSLKCFMETF